MWEARTPGKRLSNYEAGKRPREGEARGIRASYESNDPHHSANARSLAHRSKPRGSEPSCRGARFAGYSPRVALVIGCDERPMAAVMITPQEPSYPARICLGMLVDTGADVTIMPLERWPPTWPLAMGKRIIGVGGEQQTRTSTCPVKLEVMDEDAGKLLTAVVTILVADGVASPLLGRDALAQMGIGLKNLA